MRALPTRISMNRLVYSLDLIDDRRVAFSTVPVGNQIADYERASEPGCPDEGPYRSIIPFGRRHETPVAATHN
jgi:hypothetical protein